MRKGDSMIWWFTLALLVGVGMFTFAKWNVLSDNNRKTALVGDAVLLIALFTGSLLWWLWLVAFVFSAVHLGVNWKRMSFDGRLGACILLAVLAMLLFATKGFYWWLALVVLIITGIVGAFVWRGASPRSRAGLAGVAALLLLLLFLLYDAKQPLNFMGGEAQAAPTTLGDQAQHTVVRGDWLRNIAPRYKNVGWESLLLRNEPFLQAKYEEVCGKLNERYTNNPKRHGTFCNERYNRPYGNTLVPGWVLAIPSGSAPQQIQDAVITSTGQKVALVIDDSGSMNDDRTRVALMYDAALRKHGKNLIGVWLYADGQVRHYSEGNVELHTTGNVENTWNALSEAAKEKPDTIILVTDEVGDDWPADLKKAGTGWFTKMQPVVATCLPPYECEVTLNALVNAFGGKYVRYGQ